MVVAMIVARSLARRRSWPTTQGVVIGGRWRDGMRYLHVRFVGPDGCTRDFRNRYGSNLTYNRVGSTVTVRVNPENFDDAVVQGPVNGGGCFAVLVGVVGVVFVAVGLAALAVAGWWR